MPGSEVRTPAEAALYRTLRGEPPAPLTVLDPEDPSLGPGRSPVLEVFEFVTHARSMLYGLPEDESLWEARLWAGEEDCEQALRFFDLGQREPAVHSNHGLRGQQDDPLLYTRGGVNALRNGIRAVLARLHGAERFAVPHEEIEAQFPNISLFESMGHTEAVAEDLLERGDAMQRYDEPKRALVDYTRARDLARGTQAMPLEGLAELRIAELHRTEGLLVTATEHAVTALGLFRRFVEPRGAAEALLALGRLWSLGRSPADARRDLDEALGLFETVGSESGVGTVLFERAKLTLQEHGWSAVEATLRDASRRLHSVQAPVAADVDAFLEEAPSEPTRSHVDAWLALGRRALTEQDPECAHALFDRAVQASMHLFDAEREAQALMGRARAESDLGRPEEANWSLVGAEGFAHELRFERLEAQVLHAFGDLARQQEHTKYASTSYTKALSLYEDVGVPHRVALCHARLAQLAMGKNDRATAKHHADLALTHASQAGVEIATTLARAVRAWLDDPQP
ncbi:MAG: hypothetical protein KTR31_35000 [Myxococcales bacterium]|nr:hypothetical protein [Myxococcales bacterium]